MKNAILINKNISRLSKNEYDVYNALQKYKNNDKLQLLISSYLAGNKSKENIIEERDNLLQLFISRINDNIPDENIFNDDIKVDSDDRYKLIFTCKSKTSDIYKYVFHIFI